MPEFPSMLSGSLDALVGQVADEFLQRQQRGERPDVEEFASRHPEAAELIRNVLRSLQLIDESGGSTTSDEELAGTLGDFRILREVGRGGMGVVYEAEQISLGRRVALKVLPFAATMDPRQLQRFHNEARAAASLHHEHIVPVYAVGCERGVHFYAMQFIDGLTLAQIIARDGGTDEPTTAHAHGAADTPRPAATEPARDASYFRRVAGWGVQAAEALEHAHSLGVVHRDVKPGNLMIDAAGKLWVADFGLARTGAEGNLTMTGDVLGTLRYMSPEQALAKHGLVDHRTDVYALGATLYELLTGKPAVEGKDRAEILQRIASEEPTPPRRHDCAIPTDLQTIVLKALSKEFADRYRSAADLAADLRRWQDHKPIRARPPSLADRAAKWTRRHRPVVWSALAVLLLGLVGLGAGLVFVSAAYRTESELRGAADRAQGEEARERARAERERDLALRRRYAAEMRLGMSAWREGHAGLAQETLDQFIPSGGLDVRGWEWYLLHGLCNQHHLAIEQHGTIWGLAFSPDGSRLAAVLQAPAPHSYIEVRAWDVATRQEILRHPVPDRRVGPNRVGFGFDRLLGWSSDNRRLICTGSGGARVWDVGAGKELLTVPHTAAYSNMALFAWSPGGEYLAHAGVFDRAERGKPRNSTVDAEVTIWEVGTGKKLSTHSLPGETVKAMAWTSDGHLIANRSVPLPKRPISGAASQLRLTVWEGRTGRQLSTADTFLADAGARGFPQRWSMALHPDGRTLALAHRNGISVWNLENGKAMARLSSHEVRRYGPGELAWSPGGGYLTQRKYHYQNKSSVQVFPVKFQKGLILEESGVSIPVGQNGTTFAFSPDGRSVVAPAPFGAVKVWDLETGREVFHLRGHSDDILAVAWSGDGKYLASGGGRASDGRIRVWAPAPGRFQEAQSIARKRPGCGALIAWAPDSRRLVSLDCTGYGERMSVASDARIWNVETNQLVRSIEVHLPNNPAPNWGPGLAWNPRGEEIAVLFGRPSPLLWDASSGQPAGQAPFFSSLPLTGVWGPHLRNPAFSPDGKWVAFTYDYGSALHTPPKVSRNGAILWERESGRWSVIPLDANGTSIAFSPDSRRLALAHHRRLFVRDLTTGRNVMELDTNTVLGGLLVRGGGFTWAPDGTRLACFTGWRKQRNNVTVLDASTGEVLQTYRGHLSEVCSVSWHPDGDRLASACKSGAVKVWDTLTGAETLSLQAPGGEAYQVAWSPNGKRLAASGANGVVKVWDASPGYRIAGRP